MESPDDELFDDPTATDPEDELDEDFDEDLGEDHRGDNPGYDFDEQAAIEELRREQDE